MLPAHFCYFNSKTLRIQYSIWYKVSILLGYDALFYPRRMKSCTTLVWKPQNLHCILFILKSDAISVFSMNFKYWTHPALTLYVICQMLNTRCLSIWFLTSGGEVPGRKISWNRIAQFRSRCSESSSCDTNINEEVYQTCGTNGACNSSWVL